MFKPNRFERLAFVHKLMLVQENERRRQALGEDLALLGYDVARFAAGGGLLKRAREERPDVVLLGLDGVRPDLDRFVTLLNARIPIIGLTVETSEELPDSSFRIGPDVQVADPSTPEAVMALDATIKALLETPAPGAGEPIRLGRLTIDPRQRIALMGSRPLNLLRMDFQILLFLAQQEGRRVKRDDIAQALKPVGGTIAVTARYANKLRSELRNGPAGFSYLKGNLRDGLLLWTTEGERGTPLSSGLD